LVLPVDDITKTAAARIFAKFYQKQFDFAPGFEHKETALWLACVRKLASWLRFLRMPRVIQQKRKQQRDLIEAAITRPAPCRDRENGDRLPKALHLAQLRLQTVRTSLPAARLRDKRSIEFRRADGGSVRGREKRGPPSAAILLRCPSVVS
jgi:hypothetical protein